MFMIHLTATARVRHPAQDEKTSPNCAGRRTFSNRHFDPQLGADLYNTYLDEYEYAEKVGFDGLMLNEHHNTPTCLDVAVNLSAAALTQRTRSCKILLLGNVIATWDNPIRLAEEVAMLDLMSSGRIISGFVRGI